MKKGIQVKKIMRDVNAAGALASYSTMKVIQRHLDILNCELRDMLGDEIRRD